MPGTTIAATELAVSFGLEEVPAASGRASGHLFIFVDQAGMLEASGRLRYAAERPWPSETAYVLAECDDGQGYCYLGVGRGTDEQNVWTIPDADYETWRKWGTRKDASRRLPDPSPIRRSVPRTAARRRS